MERARQLTRRDLLKFACIGTAELLLFSCTSSQQPSNATSPEKPSPTISPESHALGEHDKFHYRSEGKNLPVTPFLYLPFSRVDFGKVTVAQGWEANENEKARSKVVAHEAIDFAAPYGTKVVAPCDGIVISSCEEGWRVVGENQVVYNGKKVAYGGGIFVEIAREDGQRVQLLHLSSLDSSIPFSKPNPKKDGGWSPTKHSLPFDELKKIGKPVKAGDIIGTVGLTGLEFGTLGKYQGEDRPLSVTENELETWDEVGAHVHLEIFEINEKGGKFGRRDPFAIYSTFDKYSLDGKKPLGKDPLFYLNQGIPQTSARLSLRDWAQFVTNILRQA